MLRSAMRRAPGLGLWEGALGTGWRGGVGNDTER